MKEIVVKVKPGGNAYFIYSDGLPFKGTGKMDLVRASNVLWDADKQRWVIVMPNGTQIGRSAGYDERMQAIAEEVQLLSKMISEGHEPWEVGFKDLDEQCLTASRL